MARKKAKKTYEGPHIFWRNGRAYADFRSYADVGGTKGALTPDGGPPRRGVRGVADEEVARALFDAKLDEFKAERKKRAGVKVEEKRNTTLDALVKLHLEAKAKAKETSHKHMVDLEIRLQAAIKHFGYNRNPRDIEAEDVRAWAKELGEGGSRKPGTVRHYLNALSGLYKRAVERKVVDPGYNPVADLMEKPSGWSGRGESKYLEVHEAALLLEAARVVEARDRVNATPGLHTIVAALLLTGGRFSEVVGLDVEDVSFDRERIYFRPNAHRGLKTNTSERDVPLWPQLRLLLQTWMFAGDAPRTSGLLFPASPRTGGGMIQDLRKSLDEMGTLCGYKAGEIRSRMFRHTYCAARLQTVTTFVKPGHKATDPDALAYVDVNHDTVAREMGHGGHEMVKRVYGHIARTPFKSDAVEYRTEQHKEALGERLSALTVGRA